MTKYRIIVTVVNGIVGIDAHRRLDLTTLNSGHVSDDLREATNRAAGMVGNPYVYHYSETEPVMARVGLCVYAKVEPFEIVTRAEQEMGEDL